MSAFICTVPFPSAISRPAFELSRSAELTPCNVLVDGNTCSNSRLWPTRRAICSPSGREAGCVPEIAPKDTDSRSCAALAHLRSADKHRILNGGLSGLLNRKERGALTSHCGGGLASSRAGVPDARFKSYVIRGLHCSQAGCPAEKADGCLAGGLPCLLRRRVDSLGDHHWQCIGNSHMHRVERGNWCGSGNLGGSVSKPDLLPAASAPTTAVIVVAVISTIRCIHGFSSSSGLLQASCARAAPPVAVVLHVGVKEGAHLPVACLFSQLPPHLDAQVDRRRQEPHLDDEVVLP